ncbi:MAG: hypothetical protein ABI414_15425 [Devosia sp.]
MSKPATRLGLATAALLTLALPTFAQAEQSDQMAVISPEQLGQIFCIASLGNDMTPIEAMLTPVLNAEVAAADINESLAVHRSPDKKGPLSDGLPWRSVPDHADGCTVGTSNVHGAEASVEIHYSFSQHPDAGYTDTLLLAQVYSTAGRPQVWRLDDIILANDQTFIGTLVSAFEP